jgi:hypothetical protein
MSEDGACGSGAVEDRSGCTGSWEIDESGTVGNGLSSNVDAVEWTETRDVILLWGCLCVRVCAAAVTGCSN